MKKFLHLNSFFYLNNIPSVYLSLISTSRIQIGPLTHKKLETPCMESFVKRKVSTLKNPKMFLSVLQQAGQKHYRPINNDKVINIGVNMLRLELDNYFLNGFSNLLGTHFELNLYNFQLFKSRIISVHNLSYKETPIISPFN